MIAHPGECDIRVGPCGLVDAHGGRRAAMKVVVAREHRPEVAGKPERAHLESISLTRSRLLEQRIFAVNHQPVGRGFGNALQQLGGRIDLAESVELIAQHVEQQREARFHPGNEVDRVRLVELEHGDVSVEPTREGALLHRRGDHPAREV